MLTPHLLVRGEVVSGQREVHVHANLCSVPKIRAVGAGVQGARQLVVQRICLTYRQSTPQPRACP
jgi:hypothetical protein